MNRRTISYRIADIQDSLTRLGNNLCAMGTLDIQRYPENYEAISTEAALRAEKIACQLRNLLYASTTLPKREYLSRAGEESHGISISVEDGIVKIVLPRLLPKKKGKLSSLFLCEPLHACLDQFTRETPFPRFRECVVCVSHIYDHEFSDQCLFDYDNLQQKQILDTIALYLMEDDTGLLCDAYNTTELGNANSTHFYIMEKDRFAAWLQKQQGRLKTISDF